MEESYFPFLLDTTKGFYLGEGAMRADSWMANWVGYKLSPFQHCGESPGNIIWATTALSFIHGTSGAYYFSTHVEGGWSIQDWVLQYSVGQNLQARNQLWCLLSHRPYWCLTLSVKKKLRVSLVNLATTEALFLLSLPNHQESWQDFTNTSGDQHGGEGGGQIGFTKNKIEGITSLLQ